MEASTPLDPLTRAIYERLTGDVELMGMVTAVADWIPEDQPHPYVRLGEALETPDNTHDGFGRESVFTLNVWSRQRGFGEARAIGARVMALLDHQPLSAPGLHVVACRYEFGQTLPDPDPEIRRMLIRFRLVTEQLPATP